MVRFPCGHLEPETVVLRRLRTEGDAIWMSCKRCKVIVLMVDARTPARAGRRREQAPADRGR